MKSDQSMEPPHNFKRECWTPELSEFCSSLLTEDHYRCSVCSEGLREPVSVPCGHSYCRKCISTYWAQPGLGGDYVCPQCSKSFTTRPDLSINTALARVLQALQQTGFSPLLPAVAHAGPGDVACDICCGPKLRAVKTCETCGASYCESHVRQHYTVPALQRHTLTQATGDQRHTHQQDSIWKVERIKEEE
ncbi:E3 ubiquitin/ISG15 ligase TRIM25-like [Aplochiton taeniatus]